MLYMLNIKMAHMCHQKMKIKVLLEFHKNGQKIIFLVLRKKKKIMYQNKKKIMYQKMKKKIMYQNKMIKRKKMYQKIKNQKI